uniref:Carboxypeptidase M n=1 Tax=Callorhinchus milii TaxID=7868 RepID=A0A4W3KIL2_CALMI
MTFLWLWAIISSAVALNFTYHNGRQLETFLRAINQDYPSITHLYSIGKSVDGIDLWVLAIGKYPTKHAVGIPDIKYVANIHGDEVVGREMLLHLIEHLVTMYGVNDNITALINSTRVHIMPSMNPDGFAITRTAKPDCNYSKGRKNKNAYDLNRNFPDIFENNTLAIRQPETSAVIDWVMSESFVLSASLHGGDVVASYPFDNIKSDGQKLPEYSKTPDDDIFIYLAKKYSYNHLIMYYGEICVNSLEFQDGITNGAQWYVLAGGMQDFNYVWGQCLELTLELSCCKNPPEHTLEEFWEENRVALIEFLKQVHLGIKGQILNVDGNPIENAQVQIQGRDNIYPFETNKWGEYYRLLLPGSYTLIVTVPGVGTILEDFELSNNETMFSAMKLNIHFSTTNITYVPSIKDGIYTYQNAVNIALLMQQNIILLVCPMIICTVLLH